MISEILKWMFAVAAGAGIKGEFEIRVTEMEDNDNSDVAAITISPQKSEQGEVRIALYKGETEINISASSEAGVKFAKKVRAEILSHPEIFSCIINER